MNVNHFNSTNFEADVFDRVFNEMSIAIGFSYASEAHYQAICFHHLLKGGIDPRRILIDSVWVEIDLANDCAPGHKKRGARTQSRDHSAKRTDIVVMPELPTGSWCKLPAYSAEDFRNASLAIEIKRATVNIAGLYSDIDRLVKIRKNSNNKTAIRMLLIDDQLHRTEKKFESLQSATNKAKVYARKWNVPFYEISAHRQNSIRNHQLNRISTD